MKRLISGALCAIAAPALAQSDGPQATVYPCDDAAGVITIAEPWEDNIATYADGKIRVALLDYTEPAAAAMKLLILSPPYDEVGLRACQVVGLPDGLGFANINFAERKADYDTARGLTLTLPVQRYPLGSDQDPDHGWYDLDIMINQATGDITLEGAQ